MKSQVELGNTLYESFLTYEDAFAVLDSKVRNVFDQQVAINTALQAKVEEMQKTLEWYADDSRYEQTDGFLFPKILYDRGERARQALKGETE